MNGRINYAARMTLQGGLSLLSMASAKVGKMRDRGKHESPNPIMMRHCGRAVHRKGRNDGNATNKQARSYLQTLLLSEYGR